LLDEVFVICGIIKVEVSVISRAEGEADNAYRNLDNFAYRKNRILEISEDDHPRLVTYARDN
jgi:hypothetical protein